MSEQHRRIEALVAAVDPAPRSTTEGWVSSEEGEATFEEARRAASVPESAGAAKRPRSRVALVGVAALAAVALAALGVSVFALVESSGTSEPGRFVSVEPGSAPPGSPPLLRHEDDPGGQGASTRTETRVVESSPSLADGPPAGVAAGAEPTSGNIERFAGPRGIGDRIAREATLRLEVEAGAAAGTAETVREVAADAGGFVESSERSRASATVTIRVPAERFDAVLERLEGLGEVAGERVVSEDVSAEVVDVEARLRTWRSQRDSLLALMEETTSVEESINVRSELVGVQERIEQLEGRRQLLADRVAMAAVTVDVFEPNDDPPPDEAEEDDEPAGLARAWERATGAGADVLEGTLVALGGIVPILVVWVLPLALVWRLFRRRGS